MGAFVPVKNIVKVHCNLHLVDNTEEIVGSDANIDWSSDEDLEWLTDIKAAFELLWIFANFIVFWTFLNFILNVLSPVHTGE